MKDNDKQGKKPNFWQRTKTWWKLTYQSYVVEVQDRILMSWKRLIKFAGITIIPILYGVICTMAFWNPIEGIGNAPIAVMDEDYSVLVVSKYDTSAKKYNLGTVKSFGGNDIDQIMTKNTGLTSNDYVAKGDTIHIKNTSIANEKQKNIIEAQIFANSLNVNGNVGTYDLANGESVSYDNQGNSYNSGNTTFSFKLTSAWDALRTALNPKTDENAKDTDYNFESSKINLSDESVKFTKIKYLNDKDEIENHQWQKTKYWSQVKIPEGYTERLVNYVGFMLNNPNNNDISAEVAGIKNNPLEFWSTHERNFIYGYLINTVKDFIPAVVLNELPAIANVLGTNNLANSLSNNGAQLKQLLGASNADLISIPGVNGPESITDTNRYVMAKSSGLSTSTAALNDAALFGDVDNTNPNATPSMIGGKFINLVENGLNFASDSDLQNILGKLGISSDSIGKDIADIINKIKAALGGSNKDSSTKNYVINTKIASTSFDTTTPDSLNTGIVYLNKAVYEFTTGKPLGDQEKAVLQKVWKAVTGKDLPTDFKNTPLFENDERIINQELFEQRVDLTLSENPQYFANATKLNEILPNLVQEYVDNSLHGFKPGDAVNAFVQGNEFGIYGFGLGIFFLTLGLFVGAFTQTFIFDRAKRLSKAKWSNWYVSKTLLMLTVAFFQVTAEVWIIYAFGWHSIGAVGMCYVWLWLLFCDMIFVSIVQGLWYLLKDETIGKFLVIIIMVLSIGAGGGEFPALSQLPFFHVISYVVPFTYVFKGFDEIVFGVAIFGTKSWTTAYIFEQIGILLIYFAVFHTLGLFLGGRNRMKEMNYGSHYGYAVAGAMRALGLSTANFQTLKRTTRHGVKIYKYNWASLGNKFRPELYFQCRRMYKFEGQFKWWARKHHDFVQKPNYSDEEIVSRNE